MSSTDRHDRTNLDARAAAAARDLLERTAARPILPFTGPDALMPAPTSRAPHRHRALLAAAAVLAALAVAAAAFAAIRTDGSDGSDDDPAMPVRTSAVPAYTTTGAPAPMPMSSLIEGSVLDPEDSSPLAIYGPGPDAPTVGIARVAGWSEDELRNQPGPDLEPVEDQGGLDLSSSGYARHAVVVDDPARDGAGILLLSPTLPADRLVQLARTVTFKNGRPRLPADQQDPSWRLLGDDPGGVYAGSSATARRRGVAARAIAFGGSLDRSPSEEAPQPALLVASEPSTGTQLIATRLTSASVRKTEVDGHPALAVTSTHTGADAQRALVWEPAPGVLLRVTGWDASWEVVETAAAGTEPLSATQWQDLLDQAALGLLAPDPDERVLAQGELPDGARWSVRGSASSGLQLSITDQAPVSASGGSSTDFHDDVLRQLVSQDEGGRTFVGGLVDPTVATVRIAGGGASTPAEPLDLDAASLATAGAEFAGGGWFVLELPGAPAAIELLDADGAVIRTQQLAADGQAVGQPVAPR